MDGNRARNDASAQGGVVGNGGGGSQGASSSTSAAAAASAAGAGAGAVEGLPFYEKERQRLKELIAKKRAIDRRLQGEEERIYRLETEYLESTPSGNIIIGFDNYTKGAPSNSATAAAARRKGGGGGGGGSSSQFDPQGINSNRVFSRSSVSYNGKGGNGGDGSDGVQTPGGASTPGGGIGEEMAHTPGSGRNAGGGGPNGKKVVIKKRESSTAADVDDGGEREAKKVRVSFGGGGGGANGTPGAGRK